MARAFVLLNVNLGTEEGVLARLRRREGVKEAHQVYGVHHIIARLSGGWKILRRLALYRTKGPTPNFQKGRRRRFVNRDR